MSNQPYDPEKFKNFDRLIAESKGKAEFVLIHHPEVLGDTYTEIVTNLNKMAEAGFALRIIPPSERGKLPTQQPINSN